MSSYIGGAGAWEGLGGPIQMEDYREQISNIDPTLDSCCQREIEDNIKMGIMKRALQRHDVVSERERRRRHLICATGFEACRCSYDPNVDGGDYVALMLLRSQRGIAESLERTIESYGVVDQQSTSKKEPETKTRQDSDEDDSADDDEFDYLLDETLPGQGEELLEIENHRRAELEMEMLQREVELQHGYGVHRQMHPSRVLKAAGLVRGGSRNPCSAVVVHLFEPDSVASASLDLYLEELAKLQRGTKFLRADGRTTLQMESSLVAQVFPRLCANRDLPVLIAIKDGVAIQTCSNLQYFTKDSANDQVLTDAVYDWLNRLGVLLERAPPLYLLCQIRPEEEVLLEHMAKEAAMAKQGSQQQREFYRCGVPGCQKTFPHQHVGIETQEQSGLVVSESEILGGGEHH